MYVCLCKGVTENRIRREVLAGATTYEEIQLRLEVGLCCGQCRESTQEVIQDTLSGHHQSNVINMWQPSHPARDQSHLNKAYG